MKKFCIRLLAVLVVALIMSTSIFAYADVRQIDEPVIQPRWTEISIYQCLLTEKSGIFSNAHVDSYVATYSAYSKVDLVVTVQEWNGGAFVDTSRTWSASGTAFADVTKDIKLSSGNYRIKSVATIHSSSGQYIETVTQYSDDIMI